MQKTTIIMLVVILFGFTGELFAQSTLRRIRREVRRERNQLRDLERDASRVIERAKDAAKEKSSDDFPVLNFLRDVQGIGADPGEKPGLNIVRQLLSSQPKNADDLHPAYSASFANLSELDDALSNMSRMSDSEEYYSDFKNSAETWGGNFLDPDRTAGFVLLTDGLLAYPMIFVPILPGREASNEFLATFGREIKPGSGQVEIYETPQFRWVYLGNNPYVRLPADTIVVHKGEWGYILSQSMINALPEDPRVFLPKVEGKYLVSDYFYFDGLPRRLGNLMLNIGELVVKFSDPNKSKFGPEQKVILGASLDYGRMFVNETRSIFRGIKVDDASGDVIIETILEVVPDGQLSGYFQRQSVREATVAGFYQPNDALFAVLVSEELNPSQKQIANALIRHVFRDLEQRMRTEQELRAAENAAEREEIEQEILRREQLRKERSERKSTSPEETARDPREIAGSFAGSVSEYFSGAWNSSISAAFENTKDQLELESLKKVQTILHENIEQGLLNCAVTTKPGGNTIGAFQFIGGNELSAVLSGAQLKINTDRRSAHLRDKVRLNYATFQGYRISSIIMPIKELKGTETLPPSLREETLHLYLGVKADRFCFGFGRDPSALDELKNAIENTAKAQRIPSRTLVLSPYELGRLLEPYAGEMKSETAPEAVRTLLQAAPDSLLSYEVAYTPVTYYSVLRIPKSLWSAVGKLTAKKAKSTGASSILE